MVNKIVCKDNCSKQKQITTSSCCFVGKISYICFGLDHPYAQFCYQYMRQISNINIDLSITKGKLTFDENWSDKFNRFAVYIFFSTLIYLPIVVYLKETVANPSDSRLLNSIGILSILFGLYIFFRNATEKNLIKIETNLSKKEIRLLLLSYAEKQQYEIYRKSDNCLIFNEANLYNSSYKKTIIFLLQDNKIFLTVLRDNFKLNVPTFTTHLIIKRDISKLMTSARN